MKFKMSGLFYMTLLTIGVIVMMNISACAMQYYVDDTGGRDTNTGDASAPFKTVQRAANLVQPGDVVIIRPGIYYDPVRLKNCGTKEKPIIFRAEDWSDGSVIMTGARRDIREKVKKWQLEDASLGLYSIPLDYPINRMIVDNNEIAEYNTLTGLKTYRANEASNMPGYQMGFYTDTEEGKLYLRLRADEKYCSKNPNNATVCVPRTGVVSSVVRNGVTYSAQNGSAMTDESYIFGVLSEKPAYTIIEGITFEMSPVAAVWARCDELVVNNCRFYGCRQGVRGATCAYDEPVVSKNITISNCYYTNFPIYTDAMEILVDYANDESVHMAGDKVQNFYFWHAKSAMQCNYEGCGMATHMGDGWQILDNHFYDGLDFCSSNCNFSYWQTVDGKKKQTPACNITMKGNRYENAFDNAIEVEDNMHDVEISYNEFLGNVDPISLQPLAGTPFPTNVNFHHNVIYNTPEQGWEWYYTRNYMNGTRLPSIVIPGVFKIGINTSMYGDFPWMADEPLDENGYPIRGITLEDDGVKVWNNTIIMPNLAFEENVGSIGGGTNNWANISFYNNIFQIAVSPQDGTYKSLPQGRASWAGRGYDFGRNMLVFGLDIQNDPLITNKVAPKEAATDEPILANGGVYVDNIDKVGFKNWRNKEIELTENSVARNKAVDLAWDKTKSKDLGAVDYGEEWNVICGPFLRGDVNRDGKTDMRDVHYLASCIGKAEFDIHCDLNHNGNVDKDDLTAVLEEVSKAGGALIW